MSRYRLQPTPVQEQALLEHCGHARFVWNLAVEQHGCWRPGRRSAPGFAEQCRQLTRARAEFAGCGRVRARPRHRQIVPCRPGPGGALACGVRRDPRPHPRARHG
ncbi:helix-turn-helix domain-containing protein [Spirillospora sp. CA-142024]|uniref:helix-turn-helix domain-containing protein n=1 Tax=Spirillospora sp. CA-142024 TaxID=3240036 RepID=UPI003D915E4A